ncbi:DNA-binding protein [Rhodoferax sp.]|uniref:DNA-binding protein n=1 Tax=Rhodoferax sp. TaxID=50421 RepID=UPI00374D50D7
MREAKNPQQFTPLDHESRPTVDTAAAAHYLHLAQQTLRIYACKESGPLRPRRINGRLHWVTADIRRLLGVA